MKKIGIMGGTFNPIHNAHLMIGEFALEEFSLDQILFLTGGNPPHKRNEQIISKEWRHKMVLEAIRGNPGFHGCDYEIKKQDYSYTVNTIAHLKEIYPKDQIFFIIGSDSLRNFHTWYQPEKILSLCTLLVYPRKGQACDELIFQLRKKWGGEIYQIHAPMFDISSTMLRKRIASGLSVKYLIPDGVIEMIHENQFYKDDDQ